MVIVRSVLLLALAAAGCLGKPPLPVDDPEDGGTDGPDGDAAGCPAGTTPLPSDLVVRPIAEVADFDPGAGNTNDDLLVWGRDRNGLGEPHAYLIAGRDPMNLDCFDRAFPFPGTEPIDLWVGEVTGDGNPDLVMLGRDDGSSNDYPIHLYVGLPTGGVGPSAQVRSGDQKVYNAGTGNLGGSLGAPQPGYVVGWTSTTAREVVFGGLHEPLGSLEHSSSLQPPVLVRNQTTNPTEALGVDAIQDVVVHTGSNPQQLIAFTQEAVFTFSHTQRTAEGSHFEPIGQAALTDPRARSIRHRRALVAGQTIVATESATGFDLVRVSDTGSPSVLELQAPDVIDESINRHDLALAQIDDDTDLDLVALVSTSSTAMLWVYPKLTFGPAVTAQSPISLSLPLGTNILAVGDFDGSAATPDQILALTSSVSSRLGSCYQVLPGSPTPCIAACGSTSCP